MEKHRENSVKILPKVLFANVFVTSDPKICENVFC